ncbi:MAG: phosphopyruvate hydratase [Desulfurococcales archaeon]|nr:phosphopyruvate hydratase [Desulfurococcales archaeon]
MDNLFTVEDVNALIALDSRGNPTVKAVVRTRGGIGVALAPSGASTGKREAIDLRDGGKRWLGRGVDRAIANIHNVIRNALIGIDSRRQAYVDSILVTLDGTDNMSKLGGNATTAVSIAVAKAASTTAGFPLYQYLGGPQARLLPAPLMNILNGGVHAGNDLDIQEFMIIPVGADKFIDALRIAVEVYGNLKNTLKEKYGKNSINVGDEGGFAPPLKHSREALSLLVESISRAGYEPGEDVLLAMDAAASQFYDSDTNTYHIDGLTLTSNELSDYYKTLVDEYDITIIEDPFDEDDWSGFKEFTSKMGNRVMIIGDDVYTTKVEMLKKGIEGKWSNAVLVKVNQVGTLTEAIDFTYMAMRNGMKAVISHRSGETEDSFIADLAVALGTGFIKTGAPARGERVAKYNRLIEIEQELEPVSLYNNKRPI